MNWRDKIAWTLLIGALVPFIFLIYSLSHFGELGLHLTHPRIWVELGLGLGMLGLGMLVLTRGKS